MLLFCSDRKIHGRNQFKGTAERSNAGHRRLGADVQYTTDPMSWLLKSMFSSKDVCGCRINAVVASAGPQWIFFIRLILGEGSEWCASDGRRLRSPKPSEHRACPSRCCAAPASSVQNAQRETQKSARGAQGHEIRGSTAYMQPMSPLPPPSPPPPLAPMGA
jgi:hypothetical protein